jgi:D-serine deaminase-like pyridoxal phosphate-dependent protein
MARRASDLGVKLRPHLKTAKSVEIARLATKDTFGGIAVSTLSEARYFGAVGFTDILYGVGVVPSKAEQLLELQRSGVQLTITLDSVKVVEALDHKLRELGSAQRLKFDVLIEIDVDGHRNGVDAAGNELFEIAAKLRASRDLRLRGIMSHAGESYKLRAPQEIADLAERERLTVVLAAKRLTGLGYDCPTVSVGSTPTATFAHNMSGVTELRVGVYMFGDLFQMGLGCCNIDDLAVSVLATVIHQKPELNRVLIDAGALALSKDRSTADQPDDFKYGLVADISGTPTVGADRHIVSNVNQEHGLVTVSVGSTLFDRFPSTLA